MSSSSSSSLLLLTSLPRKSWKDKLLTYQHLLQLTLSHDPSLPSQLPSHFPSMLKQKNLNLIAKVLDLIVAYAKSHQMSIQVGNLVRQVFQFAEVVTLPIERVVASLWGREGVRQVLVESCWGRSVRKTHRAVKSIRVILQEAEEWHADGLEGILEQIENAPNSSIFQIQQQLTLIKHLLPLKQ